MKAPKFTILMPVVKTHYFKEAFYSAVNQKYDDYEILVLNNRADMDISWVKQVSRVRYVENENRLLATDNWNKGIELANGEYVIILSDDDLLAWNFLSEIELFLERYNYEFDVVRIQHINIDDRGNIISFSCPGKEIENLIEYIYNQYTFSRGQVLSDILFRRDIALEIKGFRRFPSGWATDHCIAIEIAAKKNKIGNLNKCLISYRQHFENLSHVMSACERMAADYEYYKVIAEILKTSTGVEKQLTIDVNKKRLQRQQDTHYSAILGKFEFLELWKFHRDFSLIETSILRSFIWAVLSKIKTIFTKC